MARDYIPHNAAQFRAFMYNIVQMVEKKITSLDDKPKEWNHIPNARYGDLIDLFSDFANLLFVAQGPHTSAQLLARNEAQAACTKYLRSFINQYLRFPPVTNVERAEMGIPNHDNIRTDHKVVTETVDFVVHVRNIRELAVDFWVQGMSNKAKPAGYDGAVIIWGLRDTPPESPDDLPHHAMASRTPFTLHFEEAERGKTVQIALTWQNARGIIGQWSGYKSAIVP